MKEIICSDIWELTRKSFHYKMETEFKIYHTQMIINRLIYEGFLVCDTFFALLPMNIELEQFQNNINIFDNENKVKIFVQILNELNSLDISMRELNDLVDKRYSLLKEFE